MKYEDLSSDEKLYYNLYKSNDDCFAYRINNALRSGSGLESFDSAIKLLDSIANNDVLTVENELHRATFDRIVFPFITGDEYKNPEYLSTATKASSVQQHFTVSNDPVYIKFVGLKGIGYCSLEGNSSFDATENEVLLGRNNVFKVLEARVTKERSEIIKIMGAFKCMNVTQLKIYTFSWKGNRI